MSAFFDWIIAAVVEALVRVFTSTFVVKAIVAAFVYVFVFAILPMLISFLVPPAILNALSSYAKFLQNNQWGQWIAWFLYWWHFQFLVEVMLPAIMIRFLFRRI